MNVLFFLNSNCIDNLSLKCSVDDRTDNCSVIFKKLEKVGEPYQYMGGFYQKYRLFFPINETINLKTKQNKEDMEESVKENLFCDKVAKANAEYMKIKLNSSLKPFDIEAAKSGKLVYTRDGRKARIICFDVNNDKPIVAVICCKDGKETYPYTFYPNGLNMDNNVFSNTDLMMLPEKKEGYVNLYHNCNDKYAAHLGNNVIYKDRAFAENVAKDCLNYIKTVKVEWEE